MNVGHWQNSSSFRISVWVTLVCLTFFCCAPSGPSAVLVDANETSTVVDLKQEDVQVYLTPSSTGILVVQQTRAFQAYSLFIDGELIGPGIILVGKVLIKNVKTGKHTLKCVTPIDSKVEEVEMREGKTIWVTFELRAESPKSAFSIGYETALGVIAAIWLVYYVTKK